MGQNVDTWEISHAGSSAPGSFAAEAASRQISRSFPLFCMYELHNSETAGLKSAF